jgi:hypothetical protein
MNDLDDQIKLRLKQISKWLKTGDSELERVANNIRRHIPKNTRHEDGRRALDSVDMALAAGTEAKGWQLMCDAVAYAKDYMLWHLAEHGEKFPSGRKSGTTSKIRKAVEAVLLKYPNASNLQIWSTIKLPKGAERRENSIGRYIEYSASDGSLKNLSYASFCSSHCVKARQALGISKSKVNK